MSDDHKSSTKPGFQAIFCLWCFLVILGIGACTKHQTPKPKPDVIEPRQIPVQKPIKKEASPVEAQLLHTIKTAEDLEEGHPLLFSSLYSLARYYQEQGEFEKAEAQYKRALNLKEHLVGPDHPDVAIVLVQYASLLKETHRQTEAKKVLARANAITSRHRHPSSPNPSRP